MREATSGSFSCASGGREAAGCSGDVGRVHETTPSAPRRASRGGQAARGCVGARRRREVRARTTARRCRKGAGTGAAPPGGGRGRRSGAARERGAGSCSRGGRRRGGATSEACRGSCGDSCGGDRRPAGRTAPTRRGDNDAHDRGDAYRRCACRACRGAATRESAAPACGARPDAAGQAGGVSGQKDRASRRPEAAETDEPPRPHRRGADHCAGARPVGAAATRGAKRGAREAGRRGLGARRRPHELVARRTVLGRFRRPRTDAQTLVVC
mmetsp:Transcript_20880/g.59044  ORF Transcript_20880/g.59044 Transcript_20880/m.59044 type:complete len:270 (-) Transcript_20880:8-817(-)